MGAKRIIMASALVALMTGVACTKQGPAEAGVNRVRFSVEDYVPVGDDAATKTSLVNGTEFVWSVGDTVGIYPGKGSQVYFAMETGAGAKEAEFDGGGWDFKAGIVYYCYYPFIGDIYLDKTRIPVSYLGQKQVGTASQAQFGSYDFMYAPKVEAENGTLNFSYKHLNCIIRPRLTLPAGTYTKLAVTAPTKVFATKGYFNLEAENPAIVGTEFTDQIIIDLVDCKLTAETTFQAFIMSNPVNLAGTEIIISVLNDRKVEYQCKKTPSAAYDAGRIGGLTCSSFTEVPQSMGVIIDSWGDGGSYGGDAE